MSQLNQEFARQKRIAYVGFTQQNTKVLASLGKISPNLTQYVPIAISEKLQLIFRLLLPLKVRQILATRTYVPSGNLAKKKYYPVATLLVPLILRFSISPRISTLILFLSKRSLVKFLKKIYSTNDVVILPSDYLNLLKNDFLPKTILEIRWHHSSANQKRIAPLLSYPIALENGPTDWERTFSQVCNSLLGCVVYSEFALDSFIDFGYPRTMFCVVGLEAPKPLVEVSFLNPTVTKKGFMHIGRSPLDKGLDIAVHLARESKENLSVIGSYSEEVIEWLNTFDHVNYLGVLSRSEIYSLMPSHEVYLATGVESFGFAVLEALENGLKVVGSQSVGVLEWYGSDPNVFVAADLTLDSYVNATRLALNSGKPTKFQILDLEISESWNAVVNRWLN